MKKLFLVFSIIISNFSFGQYYGDSLVRKDFVSVKTIEYYIVRYLNEERTKLGLDTLVIDQLIDRLAKKHSSWMLQYDKYEHSELKISMAEIIMIFGCGSNQYSHIRQAKAVVNAWMSSTTHRNIISNPNFKYIGVGFSYSVNRVNGFISGYETVNLR